MSLTRIVTFLGLGRRQPPYYDETIYQLDGTRTPRTMLHDVATILAAAGGDVSVLVLGTREVRARWFGADALYTTTLAKAGIATGAAPGQVRLGFREIPRGGDTLEARAIFEAMVAALDPAPLQLALPGTDPLPEPAPPAAILVDITHGFRSQPFLAAAALAHARQVAERQGGRAPEIRILYSAYEPARHGPDAADPAPVPVLDMGPFLDAARWTGAIRDIMRFGRADALNALLEQEQKRLALARRSGGHAMPKLKQLGKAARAFCDAMATIRLGDVITLHAASLARAVEEARSDVVETHPSLGPELASLARWAERCAAPALVGPRGLRAAAALGEIYRDHLRFSELSALLRETLITAWTVLALPATEILQPGAAGRGPEGKAAEAFKRQRKRCEEALNDLAHGEPREPIPAPERLARSLAEAFERIQDTRNDVQHGGLRPQPAPAASVSATLANEIEALAPVVEEVAAHVEARESA